MVLPPLNPLPYTWSVADPGGGQGDHTPQPPPPACKKIVIKKMATEHGSLYFMFLEPPPPPPPLMHDCVTFKKIGPCGPELICTLQELWYFVRLVIDFSTLLDGFNMGVYEQQVCQVFHLHFFTFDSNLYSIFFR